MKKSFLLLLITTSLCKGQSVYKREVNMEDTSITIFTNINTIGINNNQCKIFSMIFNKDSINYYTIAYLFKAPQIMYTGSAYKMKVYFEDGDMYEFPNINDAEIVYMGKEVEFRTLVEKTQLNKMQDYPIYLLRLERLGYFYDIHIEAEYSNNICKLANFVLQMNVYQE